MLLLRRMNESIKTRHGKYKLLFGSLVYFYFPLGLFLAFFTPDNILKHQWAQAITETIAGKILYVAEVGKWTQLPATQFIAAALNVAAILWNMAFLGITLADFSDLQKVPSRFSHKKAIFMYLCGLPVTIGCIALYFYNPVAHPPSVRDSSTINTLFGMATYGSLFIMSGWLMMSWSVLYIVVSLLAMYQKIDNTRRK